MVELSEKLDKRTGELKPRVRALNGGEPAVSHLPATSRRRKVSQAELMAAWLELRLERLHEGQSIGGLAAEHHPSACADLRPLVLGGES